MSLEHYSASAAVQCIRAGEFTSEELVRACLARIEATDGTIGAWCHLDGEQALEQARALDEIRRRGRPLGSLHGVPVGIKDIFDTADMPTEYGSAIHAGRQPSVDATAVAKLREAGAVIMGKTVTAEFAFKAPGKTANPHNPDYSPGGSSSGSAAAVAAGHVPLALGSQTGGSVIRPASFCGVYGLKPSQGMISRHGVLQTSAALDQIGVFARTLADVALVTDALSGFDAADPATYARPKANLTAGCAEEPPAEPSFAWFDLPFADRLAEDANAGFKELRDALGPRAEKFTLPDDLGGVIDHHRVIHHYELRRHLAEQYEQSRDLISPEMLEALDGAGELSDDQYAEALAGIVTAQDFFEEFFNDFDAILTPSAAGEPPLGLATTGDPIFCILWTYCGLPSLSLPLLSGDAGLPIGVQLVAGLEEDARLCRTAQWLLRFLDDS